MIGLATNESQSSNVVQSQESTVTIQSEAVQTVHVTPPVHRLTRTPRGDIDLTPAESDDPPPKIKRNPQARYMSLEERRAAKRKSNAEAARRCRERKAQKIVHLDHEISLLETANAEIETRNAKLEEERAVWKQEEAELVAHNKMLQTRIRQLLESKPSQPPLQAEDAPVSTSTDSTLNR